MTGSPLLRCALAALALGLLAIPAWRLTGRQAPAAPAAPVAPASAPAHESALARQTVRLAFTSSIQPSEIQVQALGKTITTLHPSSSSSSSTVEVPSGGVDLVIHASWPGSQAANALRIEAAGSDGLPITDTTLWGAPDIEDVVTIPGVRQP